MKIYSAIALCSLLTLAVPAWAAPTVKYETDTSTEDVQPAKEDAQPAKEDAQPAEDGAQAAGQCEGSGCAFVTVDTDDPSCSYFVSSSDERIDIRELNATEVEGWNDLSVVATLPPHGRAPVQRLKLDSGMQKSTTGYTCVDVDFQYSAKIH